MIAGGMFPGWEFLLAPLLESLLLLDLALAELGENQYAACLASVP